MKLLAAIGVFLVIGILLSTGIVMAVHGSAWLLVFVLTGFLLAFFRIGCVAS